MPVTSDIVSLHWLHTLLILLKLPHWLEYPARHCISQFQLSCFTAEALSFVFDLMDSDKLTHTPCSVQDDSKSLQDIQDKPWIPPLGTQQYAG
jgi:hypothetical protein